MSDLIYVLGSHALDAFGRVIEATCDVRTLANGRRGVDEVVYSVAAVEREGGREVHVQGVPYDPRPLPAGLWLLGRPEESDDEYTAPWFVPIVCRQRLPEWAVAWHEGKPRYDHATDRLVWDYGYALHCSVSGTTLGCIRVADKGEIERIVDYRLDAIKAGRDTFIKVVEG